MARLVGTTDGLNKDTNSIAYNKNLDKIVNEEGIQKYRR